MTNREWLNTLTDQEFAEWCIKLVKERTHIKLRFYWRIKWEWIYL